MKAKLRIKIMQEAAKAKNISLVSNDITKSESFKLRYARKKLNDKIEFYKMLSKELEKRNDNDNI